MINLKLNDFLRGPNPKLQNYKQMLLLQDRALLHYARRDFKTFINLIFQTKLHSESLKNTFEFNWLNEIIIEELENFISNPEVNNIMIFAPPRVGKSTISCMLLPAFLFGKFSLGIIKHGGPIFKVMSGSYDHSLASIACREVQNYMESNIYKAIFPQICLPKMGGYLFTGGKRYRRSSMYFDVVGDLSENSLNKKECFKEKDDGSPPPTRPTCSYRVIHKGGVVTGLGYNLGILDDMVKSPADISSKWARDSLFDWYGSTFTTREEKFKNSNAKKIILMTRWHHDDLPGRILKIDQKASKDKKLWRVISLPAAGYSMKDPLRHHKDRRKPGEIKKIRGMDKSYFKRKKIEVGSYYPALFQQKPTSDEGEHIKRKWIHYYDKADFKEDNFNLIIGGGDLSLDDVEGGSYNVLLRCGVNFVSTGRIKSAHVYVLDCLRKKMDYAELRVAFYDFVTKYSNWSGSFILEKAANAYAIKSEFGPPRRELKSLDTYKNLALEIPFLRLVSPKDSKPVRVKSNIGIIQFGKLFVPKPESEAWVEDFVEELVGWPKAANDDCVDALMVVLREVNDQLTNIGALEAMTKL